MASVLKISEAAALAMHAVAMLAGEESEDPVPTHTIADNLLCSEAHLSKVLQRLTKSGILGATRGPRGGFFLDRPANKISLLEIYEAIDGELPEEACLFDDPLCSQSACLLGRLLRDINKTVRNRLKDATLDILDCAHWRSTLLT